MVDDDFQTPLCENGPITSEDEHESKEEIDTDTKETGELNEEQNVNQKKVSNSEGWGKPSYMPPVPLCNHLIFVSCQAFTLCVDFFFYTLQFDRRTQ